MRLKVVPKNNPSLVKLSSERGRLGWTTASVACFGTGHSCFLIGLLTGLAQVSFKNPRMGLAAHLEGVMNGAFLIALGAIWWEVKLSATQRALAYWTVLYGTYGNWFTTTLAAILGTAALTPITSGVHSGEPWQEALITVGFVSVGLAMITASFFVLWGLRRIVAS